ncbi:MAG: heme o synthase [Pirellulales bacterium]
MTRITSSAGSHSAPSHSTDWSNERTGLVARLGDFIELTKPRIVMLELVTVVVAAHLAAPRGVDAWILWHTVLGTMLVAASAGAFNQWLEASTDARMQRTALRPLPAGRLEAWQVVLFGLVTLAIGAAQLLVFVNPLTAGAAIATWLVYVTLYTPLKTRTPLNTAVGAVSGSLPILIGWTATGAALDMRAWALVATMFLWQFPHFMAIAWLYRADYTRGSQRMLTVVDPSGLRAAGQGVVAALALIPVSLVPALAPEAGSPLIYSVWTLSLGVAQAAAAVLFLVKRDDWSARWLLRASLIYLTCWMGLLVMVAV